MLTLYRFEHPNGNHLYVNNATFLKDNGMYDHNHDDLHIGIDDDIREQYYTKPFYLTDSLGSDDGAVNILNYYYDVTDDYLNELTFRCFFRDIKCVHEWFTDDELVKIFNGGYKLYKYTFVVDFDPNKILFGRLQCAVDHEYMLLDSTIKEEMNILTICDMPSHEKFMIQN